jgi:hypothetical protein
VEVLKNEPYENVPLLNGKFTKGQYTHKIYHLASKVIFPYVLRIHDLIVLHSLFWIRNNPFRIRILFYRLFRNDKAN